MRSSLTPRRHALAAGRGLAQRHAIVPAFPILPASAPLPQRQRLPSLLFRPISSSARHLSPSSATATATPESQQEPTQSQSPSQPKAKDEAGPTHYSFFPRTLANGAPPSGAFAIDIRALRREFLELQSRAHPDLATQADKRSAQTLSARINEAYKLLSSPLLRAQYLLQLRGEDMGLGEEGKTDEPELLMEVLEVHHAIEDATSEHELEGVRTENEGRIRESEGRLETMFANDDLHSARGEAVRLKYWVAIREKIHEWEVSKGKEGR